MQSRLRNQFSPGLLTQPEGIYPCSYSQGSVQLDAIVANSHVNV